MSYIPSGVDKQVIFAPETVFGTKPAANLGVSKRRVKLELDLNRDTYTSAEITSTAQTSDQRSGVNKIEGTLSGELSCGSYATEFASLLRGTWTAGVTSGALTTVSAAATTNKLVRSAGSWLTTGFKVGDEVIVAGFATAANNGRFTVLSVTATEMVVDATLVTEAEGASVTVTVAGKKLSIPLTPAARTNTSFTCEQFYAGVNVSEIYTGCKVGTAKVDCKPSAMTTCEFDIKGKSIEQPFGTTQYFTTPAAAPTTAPLSGASGFLYVDSAKAAVVTGLNFEINGNMEIGEVIGSRDPADIFLGRISCSGEFTAYFLDNSLLQKFINESESTLTFKQKGNGTETFTVTFPRIKFKGAKKDDKEVGGLIVTVPFDALLPLGTDPAVDVSTVILQDSTL